MSRGVNERQNFLASEQKQANNDSDWISELYKEDLNYKNKLLHTIKKGPSTFYAFVSTILLLILLIYILPTTIQEHYELYDYTCGYLLSQLIRSLTNKFVFLGLAYGFTMMLYLSSRKTVYSGFTIATITSLIVFYFWYSDNSFFAYPNWGDNPAGYHPFRNCLSYMDEPIMRFGSLSIIVLPALVGGMLSVYLGTLFHKLHGATNKTK